MRLRFIRAVGRRAILLVTEDSQGPTSIAWLKTRDWAAAPAALASGMVAPTETGIVRLLEPPPARGGRAVPGRTQTGGNIRLVRSGDAWRSATAIGRCAAQVFLLAVEEKPIRHLLARASGTCG